MSACTFGSSIRIRLPPALRGLLLASSTVPLRDRTHSRPCLGLHVWFVDTKTSCFPFYRGYLGVLCANLLRAPKVHSKERGLSPFASLILSSRLQALHPAALCTQNRGLFFANSGILLEAECCMEYCPLKQKATIRPHVLLGSLTFHARAHTAHAVPRSVLARGGR